MTVMDEREKVRATRLALLSQLQAEEILREIDDLIAPDSTLRALELLAAIKNKVRSHLLPASDAVCPNCHNANEYGDYEGPTCDVCGGAGYIKPAAATPAGGANSALVRDLVEALFPEPVMEDGLMVDSDAALNLSGALIDLERGANDKVVHDTIRRVIAQLKKARAALLRAKEAGYGG